MRASVEFDPDAKVEFDDASDWYSDQDENAKAAFISAIRLTLESISRSPNSFPVVFGSHTRRAVVHRFPYNIFFTSEQGRVFVYAVFHTSRNPIVWQGRIS